MGEYNYNWEKLTRIVTEKYGQELNTSSNTDDELNDILKNMTKDLEEMVELENKVFMELGFINKSSNQNPEYVYEGDSGFDLRANLETNITLKPLERYAVPTGLFFKIPVGYEIQVRPRSGLALKQGLTVLNTPGTVDQGYTGEVKVILVNISNENVTISHGDRIAQGVLCPVLTKKNTKLIQMTELLETDRGSGGFGSTGKS